MKTDDEFNAADFFVDRHVREGRGENLVLECESSRLTYRELSEKINQFGNGLRRLGIKKGERIIILLPDIPEFFFSFLGAIKIGAVPVPVNILLSKTDYEYIFKDTGAAFAVVHDSIKEKIKFASSQLIVVGAASAPEISFSDFLKEQSLSLISEPTTRTDVAFWLYSSGSTGVPKACVHLQRDMPVAGTNYATSVLKMTTKDKCFSVSKLFFAYGLGNSLYAPLAVGASVVLMSGAPKPEMILEVIEKYHPTLVFSVPSIYVRLLDYIDGFPHKIDLSFVRVFTSAGEQLPINLFNRFKTKFGLEILDTIGSTESFYILSNRFGAARPGSTGQCVLGCEVKLLGEDDKPVLLGSVGDLYVKSDSVCAGYWNQPEKTKANFIDGWFRTGDKFYEDKDGYFWYVGRSDEMIKCNGAWVSPLEIESVLLKHPSVFEAGVVGRHDENQLIKPMAYVVVKEGISITPEFKNELSEFLKANLPNYKRPHWIKFVSQLPRTTTGKLQRFKLRESV